MANELLRALPSIESLLASPLASRLSERLSRERVRDLLREILDDIRHNIVKESGVGSRESGVGNPESGIPVEQRQRSNSEASLYSQSQTPDSGLQTPDF